MNCLYLIIVEYTRIIKENCLNVKYKINFNDFPDSLIKLKKIENMHI